MAFNQKEKLPEDVVINPGEGLVELQQHITFACKQKKSPGIPMGCAVRKRTIIG